MCSFIPLCWICLLIILLILIGILLLILLWKRRYIKYSLQNGDIQMNYKNGKHKVLVEVVLIDENRKHSLNQSDVVAPKERVRFIKNLDRPIVQVKPGKYKGELIISRGRVAEVRKCRIRVIDEKNNKNSRQ